MNERFLVFIEMDIDVHVHSAMCFDLACLNHSLTYVLFPLILG